MNAEALAFLRQANAPIADTERHFCRLTLQSLNVALAGLGKALKGGEHAHGYGAVKAADCGAGLFGPRNSLHGSVFQILEALGSEAELGEHLFMRNSLATVFLKPFL